VNKKSAIAALGLAALLAGLVGVAPAALAATSTVPTATVGLIATPGNTTVSLSWTAPIDNGGSPVTGYNLYKGSATGAENYTQLR
jgi:hypothetical protein